MGLPAAEVPSAKVKLPDGTPFEVFGLTRAEALSIAQAGDNPTEIEIQLIAFGTRTPIDEARAWYEKASSAVVQPITTKVMELSGLDNSGKE